MQNPGMNRVPSAEEGFQAVPGILSQALNDIKALGMDPQGNPIPPPGGREVMAQMMDPESDVRRKALAVAMLAPFGITAYHGSPYKFDKFDMSKVNTGQKAQSFGHGLYFAENPKTALAYRESLTSTLPGAPTGSSKYLIEGAAFPAGRSGHAALDTAQDIEAYLGYTKMGYPDMANVAKQNIERRIANWKPSGGSASEDMQALVNFYNSSVKNVSPQKILENRGALYKVDIPDEAVAKMLDWDKPLSQQPESVRKAVLSAAKSSNDPWISGWAKTWEEYPQITGQQVYRSLANRLEGSNAAAFDTSANSQKASDFLRQAGIPGIKYLDQGSRGTGKGTSNFVLFDENLAKILERK